jgi:hypothetical protein
VHALAVDWSGARSVAAQRRAIWVGEALDGVLRWLGGGFTRGEAIAEVVRRGRAGGVVGFDFSFSFPRWFVDALGAADGPGVWQAAQSHGEGWLEACEPPFWGRPGRPRPPDDAGRPGWRRTECGPVRPKSTFQIGGAGSVGTASVRGMPHLLALREAGVAVWPFDAAAPDRLVAAEVYPRWATGPVRKSRAAEREAHLAGLGRALPPEWRGVAAGSEDAFDAACSAMALSRGDWSWPPTDDVDRAEGRIVPVTGRDGVLPPGHGGWRTVARTGRPLPRRGLAPRNDMSVTMTVKPVYRERPKGRSSATALVIIRDEEAEGRTAGPARRAAHRR